jgi:hypothetical protein
MPVDDLGDESFGYLTVVEGPQQWHVRAIFVRKGATLMWLQQLEIVDSGADPVFTVDDVGEMAARAVDRLP